MADPPPEIADDTATPRWVKVFGIVALVVVLLFVGLLLIGGPGGHGPRRHLPSGHSGSSSPNASIVATGHQPYGGVPRRPSTLPVRASGC